MVKLVSLVEYKTTHKMKLFGWEAGKFTGKKGRSKLGKFDIF